MVRGSCLCGGVRFEAERVPVMGLCHCSMCRKANGAPFECAALVPAEAFAFTRGEERIAAYESSPGTQRRFCRACGSRVPTPIAGGAQVLVPAGLFDDDPGVKPSLHMFTGSKAPWWEITDGLPQFETWPPGLEPAGPG